jgi:formate/nitrite transporter FocA (FNT family)
MPEYSLEERPTLYNKATIVIFSVLLSTFVGGMIYSQNLIETDNRKQIVPVMVFSILWNIIVYKLAKNHIDNAIFVYFLPNILGGFIIAVSFWKHHIGDLEYKTRNVWMPIAIVVFVYGSLAVLSYFVNKNR